MVRGFYARKYGGKVGRGIGIRRSLLPVASMKRRSPKSYGVRGFPLAAILTFFCFAAKEKDVLHSLEMTKAGSSIPVSKAIFLGSL